MHRQIRFEVPLPPTQIWMASEKNGNRRGIVRSVDMKAWLVQAKRQTPILKEPMKSPVGLRVVLKGGVDVDGCIGRDLITPILELLSITGIIANQGIANIPHVESSYIPPLQNCEEPACLVYVVELDEQIRDEIFEEECYLVGIS